MLAHAGIEQTLAFAHLHFHWGGIKSDISKYIKCCDACQRQRMLLPDLPELQEPKIYGPFMHPHRPGRSLSALCAGGPGFVSFSTIKKLWTQCCARAANFSRSSQSVGWYDLGSLPDHFTMCCSMPYRLPLNATYSYCFCPKLLMIFRWFNYCVATGDVYVAELGLIKQRWLREVEAAASGFDYYKSPRDPTNVVHEAMLPMAQPESLTMRALRWCRQPSLGTVFAATSECYYWLVKTYTASQLHRRYLTAAAAFWPGSQVGGLMPVGIQAVFASRSACTGQQKQSLVFLGLRRAVHIENRPSGPDLHRRGTAQHQLGLRLVTAREAVGAACSLKSGACLHALDDDTHGVHVLLHHLHHLHRRLRTHARKAELECTSHGSDLQLLRFPSRRLWCSGEPTSLTISRRCAQCASQSAESG